MSYAQAAFYPAVLVRSTIIVLEAYPKIVRDHLGVLWDAFGPQRPHHWGTIDVRLYIDCCGRNVGQGERKTGRFSNGVGFIIGTEIEIASSDDEALQIMVYNGHIRKHALKYQAVKTADGTIYHLYGLVEAGWHDRNFYSRSRMDEMSEELMALNGKQYSMYRESG